MWGIFKKKPVTYFSAAEKEQICLAITAAEKRTSGEIRVFIESSCHPADAISRATAVFHQLQMEQTAARNGVLVYVAMKDKLLAIYGDEGIHNRVGEAFWKEEVKRMVSHFPAAGMLMELLPLCRISEKLYNLIFLMMKKAIRMNCPTTLFLETNL